MPSLIKCSPLPLVTGIKFSTYNLVTVDKPLLKFIALIFSRTIHTKSILLKNSETSVWLSSFRQLSWIADLFLLMIVERMGWSGRNQHDVTGRPYAKRLTKGLGIWNIDVTPMFTVVTMVLVKKWKNLLMVSIISLVLLVSPNANGNRESTSNLSVGEMKALQTA